MLEDIKKLQLVVVHWFTSSIITVELTGLSFVEVGPLQGVALLQCCRCCSVAVLHCCSVAVCTVALIINYMQCCSVADVAVFTACCR